MIKVKKIGLSLFVIFASALYIVFQPPRSSMVAASTPLVNSSSNTQTKPNQGPQSMPSSSTVFGDSYNATEGDEENASRVTRTNTSPTTTTMPIPPKMQSGRYSNGTYSGNSVNAYYGNVQVQTTIKNGKLAVVTFLQYPNNRQTSQLINSQAMPMLKQEAIQAQSAQVSGVSGATYTSTAFQQSLAEALIKAKGK